MDLVVNSGYGLCERVFFCSLLIERLRQTPGTRLQALHSLLLSVFSNTLLKCFCLRFIAEGSEAQRGFTFLKVTQLVSQDS